MPKYTKTRQQKMMADTRRETHATPLYSLGSQRLTTQAKPSMQSKPHTRVITTDTYHYLKPDVMKTTVFTGVIIVSELVLAYFLT
ncbi:MAG TPA: hypothetical protein VLF20_00600 [Patescibacteria group bacterium]|nr:hypothetical protein [Patescibacteria group bacterium]